jgi:hypothetical protein
MIFGEKIELKVYVNQHDFVSDIQTPSCITCSHDFFRVFFMNYEFHRV